MENPNVVELPSGVLVPLSAQAPAPLQTPCKGSSMVSASAGVLKATTADAKAKVSTRTFFKMSLSVCGHIKTRWE